MSDECEGPEVGDSVMRNKENGTYTVSTEFATNLKNWRRKSLWMTMRDKWNRTYKVSSECVKKDWKWKIM